MRLRKSLLVAVSAAGLAACTHSTGQGGPAKAAMARARQGQAPPTASPMGLVLSGTGMGTGE